MRCRQVREEVAKFSIQVDRLNKSACEFKVLGRFASHEHEQLRAVILA